jgi:hypothetical protein
MEKAPGAGEPSVAMEKAPEAGGPSVAMEKRRKPGGAADGDENAGGRKGCRVQRKRRKPLCFRMQQKRRKPGGHRS